MKNIIILVVILIIGTLTACSDKNLGDTTNSSNTPVDTSIGGPPNILITSGDITIAYVVGMNTWDGAKFDRPDTFHSIINGDFEIQIPYIQLGEEIKIEFEGTSPDSVKLFDFILDEKGNEKYTNKEVKEIAIQIIDGKGTFVLDANMAANFSSNSEDYEPGATIRGFRLICTWGGNECEYGFIVKSDANETLNIN